MSGLADAKIYFGESHEKLLKQFTKKREGATNTALPTVYYAPNQGLTQGNPALSIGAAENWLELPVSGVSSFFM